jgi:sporulation protein YlmC with PRC-barrel domain
MNDRAASIALLFSLACTLPAVSSAAEPAAEPQMNTGYTNRAPRTPTVSENADQIRASKAIGAAVRDTSGAEVAKIADLLVNKRDGTVDVAILNLAGGTGFKHHRATVAWNSLKFEGEPTPHFVTALSAQALAASTSFKGQAESRDDFYDVKTDLLGKKATGSDGADLGKINDLVLTFGDGRLVAVVVDTGGLIAGREISRRRLGRGAAPGRKRKLSGALGPHQGPDRSRPVMTTQAPRPLPTESGTSTPMIQQDSTGNVSGTRIPVPSARRQ